MSSKTAKGARSGVPLEDFGTDHWSTFAYWWSTWWSTARDSRLARGRRAAPLDGRRAGGGVRGPEVTAAPPKIPPEVEDRAAWTDLKELDERGEDLTSWEAEFVESLHMWLRAGNYLTARQREMLDAIREERL